MSTNKHRRNNGFRKNHHLVAIIVVINLIKKHPEVLKLMEES